MDQRLVHYMTGVESMDKDHIELFNLANVIEDCNVPSTLVSLLNKFHDMLLTHFRHEESLMCQYDYPYTERHFDEHLKLINYVNRKLDYYNRYSYDTVYAHHMIEDLEYKILYHMDWDDRQFGVFYHEKVKNPDSEVKA